jgi:hypothetical protein
VGDRLLRRGGCDDEKVDVFGRDPRALDRGGPSLDGQAGGRLAFAGDATLTDARPLDDPLVGGLDLALEVGVREATLGDGGAPSDDRSTGRVDDGALRSQCTRSQATG